MNVYIRRAEHVKKVVIKTFILVPQWTSFLTNTLKRRLLDFILLDEYSKLKKTCNVTLRACHDRGVHF